MTDVKDIVLETTSTTGTGNITLSSSTGYRTFNGTFGTGGGDVFFYAIRHQNILEWEVGTGHLSDATTLVRDTVIASSNSNSLVNFSGGTKDVVNDIPADRQAVLDSSGDFLNKDTDNLSEGGTNLYYTEARVSANTDVAANTAARHDAVTLAGSLDYLTLSGQEITRNAIDLSTDITGNIPDGSVPESAVTQHEAALTITESQISDLGDYLLLDGTNSMEAPVDFLSASTTDLLSVDSTVHLQVNAADSTLDIVNTDFAVRSDNAAVYLEDTSPTVISGTHVPNYWKIWTSDLVFGNTFSILTIEPENDSINNDLIVDSRVHLWPRIPDNNSDVNFVRSSAQYTNSGGEHAIYRDNNVITMSTGNPFYSLIRANTTLDYTANAIDGLALFYSTAKINYTVGGSGSARTFFIRDATQLTADGIATSSVVKAQYRHDHMANPIRAINGGTLDMNLVYGWDFSDLVTISAASGSTVTIPELHAFNINNPTVSGGGTKTITNFIGVNIADMTAGTNNYGINSALSSGANKFFIRHTGTAQSLFGGDVEIDGDLNHDGSNVGFYGVAPIARPSAYTQIYSTATRTHAQRTAPGAGGGSGADSTTFSGAECDALVADQQNTAQVLNQLIDDLQANGLIQ